MLFFLECIIILLLHYLQNLSAYPFLSLDIDPGQDQIAIGSADGKVQSYKLLIKSGTMTKIASFRSKPF